jgi:uncharacterized protein
MTKSTRGFASMDGESLRAISSRGGKAAHAQGTAHEWTSSEAREAARKGRMAARRRNNKGHDANPELKTEK